MSSNPLETVLASFAMSAKHRKATELEVKKQEKSAQEQKKAKEDAERMDRFVENFKREKEKAEKKGAYEFIVETSNLTKEQVCRVVQWVNSTPGLKGQQKYYLTGSKQEDTTLFVVVTYVTDAD